MSYSLIVLELEDVVPRRDPSKPNLYVSITKMPLDSRFAYLTNGGGADWLVGKIRSLREDYSVGSFTEDYECAKSHKSAMIATLRSEGYTVNRNTDTWIVYVIELDSNATNAPGAGHVYVGETSRTPEERFKQHRDGARNKHGRLYAGVVKQHGVRLRPDLAPGTKYFDQASAKRAEKEHFKLLKSKGFSVKGGH